MCFATPVPFDCGARMMYNDIDFEIDIDVHLYTSDFDINNVFHNKKHENHAVELHTCNHGYKDAADSTASFFFHSGVALSLIHI